MPASAVTPAQLKAIHACKRERGLDDETYRDFLDSRCHVRSAKDLTKWQAMAVLREWKGGKVEKLKAEGRKGEHEDSSSAASRLTPYALRRPGRDERLPHDLPTIEQGKMIDGLLHALGFTAAEAQERSLKLVKRICGHVWPQTRAEGNKVVEGLKAMHKRGWRANPMVNSEE